MRLKAEIRVQAHLRRCAQNGIFAVLARRGHEAAGAIFVLVDHGNGQGALYGPPPGAGIDEDGTPRWQLLGGSDTAPLPDLQGVLDRQINFDPDIWVVEQEDRQGRHLLDGPLIKL